MSLEACVLNFTLCPDNPCLYGFQQQHLKVKRAFVPVERGKAVALSYVWGQFNREPRTLGHFTNGDKLTMELGEDWELGDLKQALHKACNMPDFAYDCKYLWIDQLSIKQDDDANVRRTLVQIPQIYSSFNVLVLLQGGLCGCWSGLIDAFDLEKISFTRDVWNRAVHNPPGANLGMDLSDEQEEQLSRAESCVNNFGFLAWSSRVWTRQELLGSQKILARWISPSTPCPTLACGDPFDTEPEKRDYDRLIQSLTLPSRLNFEDWIRKVSGTERGAAFDTQELKAEVFETLGMIYSEKIEQAASDLVMGRGILLLDQYEKWAQTMKFLNGLLLEDEEGQRIKKTIWSPTFRAGFYDWKQWFRPSNSFQAEIRNLWEFSKEGYRISSRTTNVATEDFVSFLHILRAGRLTATKLEDYVRAVWVSCPGYEVPRQLKQEPLPTLLQDAIEQFQSRGRLLVTTAPAGLFGKVESSASWSPQCYLDERDITAANDVYGPLFERTADDTRWMSREVAHLQASYLQVNEHLRVTVIPERDKTRHLILCDAVPGHMTARQFVEWLGSIINQREGRSKEHEDCTEKMEGYLLQHQWVEPSEADFCKFLRYFTVGHNFSGGFTNEDLKAVPAKSKDNTSKSHNDVLIPKGMDWQDLISGLVCVALGLPRGLAGRHKLQVYSEKPSDGLSRLGLFSSDFAPEMNSYTVQVLPERTLFYEAVKLENASTEGYSKSRYRIVGLWVPWTGHEQFGDAPLVVDPKGMDGYIV